MDRGRIVKVTPLGTTPLTRELKEIQISVSNFWLTRGVGHIYEDTILHILYNVIPPEYHRDPEFGYKGIPDPQNKDFWLLICQVGPKAWHGCHHNKLHSLSKGIQFDYRRPTNGILLETIALSDPVPTDKPLVSDPKIKHLESQGASVCWYNEATNSLELFRMND